MRKARQMGSILNFDFMGCFLPFFDAQFPAFCSAWGQPIFSQFGMPDFLAQQANRFVGNKTVGKFFPDSQQKEGSG